MTLELLVLLSAPITVGAVVGAWTALSLRVAERALDNFPRLSIWIPWIVAILVTLGGYVLAAGQLITVSGFNADTTLSSTTLIALLTSPIWTLTAAQATLGISIHYLIDDLLAPLRLDPAVHEGLARGARLAYLLVALLTLLFGLQVSYGRGQQVAFSGGDLLSVIVARATLQPMLNVAGALLGITGIAFVMWQESRRTPAGAQADPEHEQSG